MLTSPASAWLALAHRARNIFVTSTAALQTFLWGYSWLAQPKWPIARLELCTVKDKTDKTLLEEKVGALIPSITTLAITTEESLWIDSPALVAGLTSCTELLLEGYEEAIFDYNTIGAAPSVFAALPNLRKLIWYGPAFAGVVPEPTISPFQPLMGNWVCLSLGHFTDASGGGVPLAAPTARTQPAAPWAEVDGRRGYPLCSVRHDHSRGPFARVLRRDHGHTRRHWPPCRAH